MVRLILAGGVASAVGCATPDWSTGPSGGTTTINVVGREGTRFDGYYIQDGFRIPITGTLPLTWAHTGLCELEIRKEQPDDEFALAAQYDAQLDHYEVFSTAVPGVPAVRLLVHDGLVVQPLK
jgi:hypothetical protein